MQTKLYVYKLKQPYSETITLVFSVLAKSEIEAQSIILNKVNNEIYKTELKELFSSGEEALVFNAGEVFIQYTGELKLFTHMQPRNH